MAKKKHLTKNSMKSFDQSRTDLENHQKLEAIRKDMEEKKKAILTTVQSILDEDESKRGHLVELIEDFHKHYELLCAQQVQVTVEQNNKARKNRQEKEISSSSSDSDSGSDSDCGDSSKEKGHRNGKTEDDIRKATDSFQQELEATKLEVMLLKNKLKAVSDEKETIKLANDALVSKLNSTEKTVEDLKAETKSLNSEKSNLLVEVEDVKSKLEVSAEENKSLSLRISDIADKLHRSQSTVEEIRSQHASTEVKLNERDRELLSLQQELNDFTSKNSEQIKVLEEENSTLKLDLDTVTREKKELEEQLAGEVLGLTAQISQMENLLEEKENEILSLLNKLEVNENESSNSTIEALTAKVNEFSAEKIRLEEQMAVKSSEALAQITELKEHISILEGEMSSLQDQNREMKSELEKNGNDIAVYRTQIQGMHAKVSDSDEKDVESEEEKPQNDRADDNQLTEEIQRSDRRDESIAELKKTVHKLKRDVQAAQDEASTSLEKTRRYEVQFRLSNQKLRVTEQLLAEKEQDYRMAAEKFREEYNILEDQYSKLSAELAASNRAYRKMITAISENMKNTVVGMECTSKKFEEDNENISSRMFSMSEEIHTLKHRMTEKNVEREKLEEQLKNLTEELQSEREHGLSVQNILTKLESEAEMEKEEKKKLVAALNAVKETTEELDVLLKKKNEQIIILENEKREAIKQLCLWSDNLQSRYNMLKIMITKSSS